jgi:hypothetical protein
MRVRVYTGERAGDTCDRGLVSLVYCLKVASNICMSARDLLL